MLSLNRLISVVPAALIAITFHEMSHAYAAYLLGDRTAQSMGRLSFNPISHIDPVGLLCMIFFGFGWAKPVPVNPRNFKRPKLGMAITAFAGPLSNFMLAFVSILIYMILSVHGSGKILLALAGFCRLMALLNIGLGVFNLLPIPPLDGSKILFMFLPDKWVMWFYQYEGYIRLALMLSLYLGLLNGVIGMGQSYIASVLSSACIGLLSAIGVI